MKIYTKEASRFYKSKLWQRVRDSYMSSQHYICERCGKPAYIVHHKHYIDETNLHDHSILTNFNNLEALCTDCHNKEHFGKDRTRQGFGFDSDGKLIKTD